MDAAKKTVVVLSSIVFFVMTGIAMITPAIADYATFLGADVFLAGLLVGALPAARVILDLPAGALGDRFGNVTMMKYGLAIIVVSSAVAAAALNYVMLLGMRFLEGVGSAFYVTASLAALARASPPEKRGRYMGIYVNLLLVGQTFGPVLGGLATVAWGLRAPFAAYALCAAAGLVLVYTTLDLPNDGAEARVDWGAAKRLVRNRNFLIVNLGVLGVFFARGGIVTVVLPVFTQMNWGLDLEGSAAMTGVLITIMAASSMVTMYPSGILADRYGRKWTFVSSLLLMGLVLPFIYGTRDLASAIPVMVVLGLVFGLTGPMASWATDLAPEDNMGVAMGVYRTIGDLGFLLGPVILGAMVQATMVNGTVSQAPFLFAAVWVFLSGLLLLAARDPSGERARARARAAATVDPPRDL